MREAPISMRDCAEAVIGWWQLAGIDTLVGEEPRDWLARTAAPVPAPVTLSPPAETLPATLAAMAELLATIDVPGGIGERVAPTGVAASGLMLLADMPDPAGAEEGSLRDGPLAQLFDRMMAAIGRDRASIYLTELFPVRPAGGRPDAGTLDRFARLALRHVELAAPRSLLLLGDAASRAILGTNLVEARGRTHRLNTATGTIPVIATFHPRHLIGQGGRKADAWRDLRRLMEELAS
jgi:uracil-DNA glycosylase family 4